MCRACSLRTRAYSLTSFITIFSSACKRPALHVFSTPLRVIPSWPAYECRRCAPVPMGRSALFSHARARRGLLCVSPPRLPSLITAQLKLHLSSLWLLAFSPDCLCSLVVPVLTRHTLSSSFLLAPSCRPFSHPHIYVARTPIFFTSTQ